MRNVVVFGIPVSVDSSLRPRLGFRWLKTLRIVVAFLRTPME
jgi:hypothetical protein